VGLFGIGSAMFGKIDDKLDPGWDIPFLVMVITCFFTVLFTKFARGICKMPPKGKKGGKKGGKPGQAAGKPGQAAGKPGQAAGKKEKGKGKGKNESDMVAKPLVAKLPDSLLFSPTKLPLPLSVTAAFPDCTKHQAFFSGLEQILPDVCESQEYSSCWCGLSGEFQIERGEGNMANLRIGDSVLPLFVKRVHLLEPVSAMKGEYLWPGDGALPAPSELWKHALSKVNDPMNEAYVDAIFAMCASKLAESGISPHWCKCYGTFTARADTYVYNISDEYNSMRNSSWWKQNQRLGLFRHQEPDLDEASASGNSNLFTELLEMADDDFEVAEESVTADSDGELVETDLPHSDSEVVHLTKPRLRLQQLSDSGSSSSEYEFQRFVEFRNFPVQVTLLERAEGTMDELLALEDDSNADTKEVRWSAWLFQVIAALSVAQHMFGFVHNDLHTNNVMWCTTDKTHIQYRVRDMYMRVPTFGRIMKVIDFGRSSFTLPSGFYISDAFFPDNDASNQYNCEPFYDDSQKKVEPNPSFDLARLSVSLIESLFPERPEDVKPVKVMSRESGISYNETVSHVYNLLWEWLQDDEGKNVLRNPDGEERYPDFDLYRALAADVHCAVPARQFQKQVFQTFRCAKKDLTEEGVYDVYA